MAQHVTDWDELVKRGTTNTEYGESWMPAQNPGHPNPLLGTITGYHVATAADKQTPVCDVMDRDGKAWGIWLFGKDGGFGTDPDSGWFRRFRDENPQVGERIVLHDRGKAELKGRDGTFNDLVLTVDRPQVQGGFREALGITAAPERTVAGDIPSGYPDAEVVADTPPSAGSTVADDDIPFAPSVI